MKEESTYGYVTAGAGTDRERKIEITEFVRAQYKDYRLTSISMLDDDSYVLSVENPASSGRNGQSSIWLSKESLVAMIATTLLYFQIKGEPLNELLKEATDHESIDYSFSDNLNPIQLNDTDNGKDI